VNHMRALLKIVRVLKCLRTCWALHGQLSSIPGGHSLLLNQRCPFLFDLFQGLCDLVGGHARDPQIEPHPFGIVSPIDTINEILAGSAIDVDHAHRASFPYRRRATVVDALWLETASRIGSAQQYCNTVLYLFSVSCCWEQCLTERRLSVLGRGQSERRRAKIKGYNNV